MTDNSGFSVQPSHVVLEQPTNAVAPGGLQMMPFPGSVPGCPPGLEYLASIDQLVVKQIIELFEVIADIECKNKYRILNSMDQQVFYAFEESEFCNRICCGPARGFTMHITDNQQQEVMRLERPFKCCVGCWLCADSCCRYPIFVKDKMGQKMGTIRLMNSCCKPHFGVWDARDQLLYEIWGGCCRCQGICCTGDIDFPVVSMRDHTQVGNIAKQWAGCGKECVTDADTFSVTFPLQLPVVNKALLLATIFLIDFSLYEHTGNNN